MEKSKTPLELIKSAYDVASPTVTDKDGSRMDGLTGDLDGLPLHVRLSRAFAKLTEKQKHDGE